MAYVEISHDEIYSPVDEELYEYSGGSYVLSQDEEVVSSKTYYIDEDYDDLYEDDGIYYSQVVLSPTDSPYDMNLFEFVDDEYISSEDESPVSGKTYYEQMYAGTTEEQYDDSYLYYPLDEDEVTNPSSQGLYEVDDNGIYFPSSDSVADEDKTYYQYSPDVEEEPAVIDEEYEEESYEPSYSIEENADVSDMESEPQPAGTDQEDYIYAYLTYVVDPHAEGLYELSNNGVMFLTEDTELEPGKVYYKHVVYSDFYQVDISGIENPSASLINYYNLVNGSYVKTQDTTVVSNKAYYRSISEQKHPYYPDPTRGVTPATFDDLPIESS